jgi:hypothetical protein
MLALFLGVCFAPHCEATVYHSDGSAASVQYLHDNSAQDGDTITLPIGTFEWTAEVTINKAVTIQGAGIGQTIILADQPGPTDGNSSCFYFSTVASKSYRVTGIEFQDGVRTTLLGKGVIAFHGNSTSVRLDNCTFTIKYNRCYTVWDALGVADHCTFLTGNQVAHVANGNWAGVGTLGDGSWSTDNTMGTAGAWYMEDCTIGIAPGISVVETAMDAEFGARFVLRHCSLTNVRQDSHGLEGGDDRATRQCEIYENTFTTTNFYGTTGQLRGGTAVYFNNTCLGPWGRLFQLNCYRSAQPFSPWGMADGSNATDSNQAGGPFESGTCANATTASQMYDPNKSWAPDQWVGYSIKNLATGRASVILGNSANTITSWAAASQFGMMTFSGGDQYQIFEVAAAMDMPGMGKGDLLNRFTYAWPNEQIEPVYAWNNTINGIPARITAAHPFIVEGVHFFNDTPKPGYTPYVYPHPLAGGDPLPSPTPTATPTATPTPTPTSTPAPTPTPTSTPTPTATPSPTATPTPCLATVPDFIGARRRRAARLWEQAGFSPANITITVDPGQRITWQSLPAGSLADCATATITVGP